MKNEARYQRNLFFFFGLALLSIAARTPDLKHNLNVSDGRYGVLVSLGAVGAMFSFFTVGQLVHRIGVRPVVIATGTIMYATLAMIPHAHSPMVYVLINMTLGFGFNAYNIAIHDQALKRQANSGELILPKLHGVWSIGTLLTVAIAVSVTAHISFAWHIDTLMAVCLIGTMYSVIKLSPVLIKGSKESGLKYLCFASMAWQSGPSEARTPLLTVNYKNDVSISFYKNMCNEFTYHHKSCYEKVGLYDTQFRDPFDIDMAYRESKQDYAAPFWWFADVADADLYIENNPNATSRLQADRPDGSREKRIQEQWELFIKKHGLHVSQIPDISQIDVVKKLKSIRP